MKVHQSCIARKRWLHLSSSGDLGGVKILLTRLSFSWKRRQWPLCAITPSALLAFRCALLRAKRSSYCPWVVLFRPKVVGNFREVCLFGSCECRHRLLVCNGPLSLLSGCNLGLWTFLFLSMRCPQSVTQFSGSVWANKFYFGAFVAWAVVLFSP